MSYTPPVTAKEFRPNERLFRVFFGIFVLSVIAFIAWIVLAPKASAIHDKAISALGGWLVLGAFVGTEFVDVAALSNPHNLMVDLNARAKGVVILERANRWLGVAGAALVELGVLLSH